jgi:transposase InsO family protein
MYFFTVEVVTWSGLVRFHVLFVIDLASRRVEIAGTTEQPHEAYMKQMARNLTDAVDSFLLKHKYIIMDRDPLFCHGFRDMLKNSGVRSAGCHRVPNLNAYAERWIGSHGASVWRKSYRWANLRKLVSEFVAHYHAERNHQGIGNKLVVPMNDNAANSGRVARRQRLGGVLNYYHRDAA